MKVMVKLFPVPGNELRQSKFSQYRVMGDLVLFLLATS